jgi:hypothetical protein
MKMKNQKRQTRTYRLALVMIFLFSLGLPFGLARAGQPGAPMETIPTLCGELVFLTNAETKSQALGLKPCEGGSPYVFLQNPAELFDYYQFTNAVIVSGNPFWDVKYGKLTNYIKTFTNYRQIKSCSECGQSPAPTATYTSLPTPTDTPTATYTSLPTPTDTPTATTTPTTTPTPLSSPTPTPVQEYFLPAGCVDTSLAIFAEGLGITDLPPLRQEAGRILSVARGQVACAPGDTECWREALLKALYSDLVRFTVRSNDKTYPVEQVIPLLVRLLSDPGMQPSCGDMRSAVWETTLTFALNGTPVDAFALHSPARVRVRDRDGRESGFQKGGSVVENIPNSRAVVQDESQFVFTPGNEVGEVVVEGEGEGEFTLELIHSVENAVEQSSFENIPVTGQSQSSITLTGDQPSLLHDLHGDGQMQSIPPTFFQRLALEVSAMPTPTFTPTTTPTATPEPLEILLENVPLWVILLIGAGVVVSLCLVGIVFLIVLYMRRG